MTRYLLIRLPQARTDRATCARCNQLVGLVVLPNGTSLLVDRTGPDVSTPTEDGVESKTTPLSLHDCGAIGAAFGRIHNRYAHLARPQRTAARVGPGSTPHAPDQGETP